MNSMLVPGRVVAGVDDHLGPVAQRHAVRVRGAPVRHVHRVERRLEQLVLQEHPLVRAEPRVHLGQRLGEPVLAGADVVLTRVVGAVGEPQLQIAGPGRVHDVDAFEQVVGRLAPDPGSGLVTEPSM